jgi:alkanesulfonate monooxygenase SsuD/methylene tetrahydromethanopterin reductase-like flavin-dependent oxidoreductase (luciferase family)
VRAGVAELRAALPGVKVIVAALGPKMCELAGEVADAVLFNFITPEYARTSGDLVRAGARKASRPVPTLYSYVRVALGAAARPRLQDEADRYGKIPAYAANFARMGVKPIDTTIMAETPAALHAAIARWDGVVDELVLRAITPADTVEQTLALVRAAWPPA